CILLKCWYFLAVISLLPIPLCLCWHAQPWKSRRNISCSIYYATTVRPHLRRCFFFLRFNFVFLLLLFILLIGVIPVSILFVNYSFITFQVGCISCHSFGLSVTQAPHTCTWSPSFGRITPLAP